jgi:hypothetical protein
VNEVVGDVDAAKGSLQGVEIQDVAADDLGRRRVDGDRLGTTGEAANPLSALRTRRVGLAVMRTDIKQ